MRLIDADALADASCHGGVCAECDDMYGGNNVVTNCSEVRLRFLKLIKDAPTIEERKTGEWVSATVEEVGIYKVRTRRCTYCGERAIDGTSVAGATMDIINNFCPNCGADMRGEHDG